VNGYIRQQILMLIPSGIVSVITSFYNVNNIYSATMINNENTSWCNNTIYGYTNGGITFILNNKYHVNTFGNNYGGQMSISTILGKKGINVISSGLENSEYFIQTKKRYLYRFTKTMILSKKKFAVSIKQIECGKLHALLLSHNNTVYGTGNNKYCQLSSEYKGRNIYSIQKLSFDNVKQIACTSLSSFVLCHDKVLYSFGHNFYGELGLNMTDIMYDINNIPGIRVDSVNAGGYHVSIISIDGDVYMFGYNRYGMCGIDGNDPNSIYKPTKLKLNNDILSIKCGLYTTFIKLINGDYYSFGLNNKGQLLLNTLNKEIRQPMKIDVNYVANNIILKKNFDKIVDIIPGKSETYILFTRKTDANKS